jgi:nitronate monooxygenase
VTLFTELFGIELPIVQAPMAGAQDHELAVAVARGGGLGSLPCALLKHDAIRAQVAAFRSAVAAPLNLNFFCHRPPPPDPDREVSWRARLAPYHAELGVAPTAGGGPARLPFDAAACALVEELRPEVTSFHFGLPDEPLLARVRATGAKIMASATTVAEARWLAERGCDAIIAQGVEAGGHRGMFLATDPGGQIGTFALVPQIADAVAVPVIAAGGIADGRGLAAALALGAAGVQVGTAYLRCPEAKVSPPYRAALATARADDTRLQNVLTGRPARAIVNRIVRELGGMRDDVPAFPDAAAALAPLRAAAEAQGSGDLSPLWAGQAVPLARELGAEELTRALASEAAAVVRALPSRVAPV